MSKSRHYPKGLSRIPANANDHARKRNKQASGATRARYRFETLRALLESDK